MYMLSLIVWAAEMRLGMKRKIMDHKKGIYMGLGVAAAYLSGLSLAVVSGYGITGIEWMIPCMILLAGIVYHKAARTFCKGIAKKEAGWILLMGFVYALTLVIGSKIEIYDEVFHRISVLDIMTVPFLGMFFSALILLLFSFSDRIRDAQEKKEEKQTTQKGLLLFCSRHAWGVLFFGYLLCYLPYYLTFFPGNCGPDTWESLSMAEGLIPWTNHHPVFFTGIMMVVRKLTGFLSLTGSVGVFSFLQMMAVAAVLACLSSRVLRMKVHALCKIFAVAMFAFHPFIGMYSIYLSKDVLFSVIMVLLCMKIYDVIRQEGKPFGKTAECIQLSMLFLLSSMLRNNGVYIAIVMAVVFLFLYKKHWKQIVIVFTCAIGLLLLWQGPVFDTIGIEKQSFAESASVPLQQVGYVLWEGGTFEEEDMVFLERLMPVEKVKEVYRPGYTDPYKFDEAFDDDFLNENVAGFLKVWWNGCKSHFGSYVKAYLMQTVGYWHYGETNSVCTQGCTENELGVEQIDVIKNMTGISFEKIFEKLVLAGRKAPLVCMLGSMAMQMCMVFLLMLQYMRRGCAKQAVWLIPLVILWGTIMVATPAFCLLRYLFPVFLLLPFMFAEFLGT